MLFYCPLESYKERYTMQRSAPKTGWFERNWIKAGIEYTRIDGEIGNEARNIETGCVLDAVRRSTFSFNQISQLLQLAESGVLTDNDVIYFDEFWQPGIEALPYAFALLGVKPKMYANLHAQSVDEFDFTYPMRDWMRPFEQGIAKSLDGIFVYEHCLQDLVVFGGIAPREKVHVVGLPFCSEEVAERMPNIWKMHRSDNIVFSSRWDREKNPDFFLKVAVRVLGKMPHATFTICTSSKSVRSNDPKLVEILREYTDRYPNIRDKTDLTKEEYYAELARSKIQFNCANQDFVSNTLLEASVAGCYPIYPYFRSFPKTLLHQMEFMYCHLDVEHAAASITTILGKHDLWTRKAIESRSWIHTRFDLSWKRMLKVMGLCNEEIPNPFSEECL